MSGMELRYRELARANVSSFVFHYEEAILSLYRDTGIWSEDFMLRGVAENANQLFGDIFDTVERQLNPNVILGRKKLRSNMYELSFYLGSRLVVVYYSEDKQKKVRWVESISINRKPIIF